MRLPYFLLLLSINTFGQTNPILRPFGIALPVGSSELKPNIYQSSKSYSETVKEFKQRFAQTPIKIAGEEINLPQVRSLSFINTNPNYLFKAINIFYVTQSGLTLISFIAK